jgi:hypothetical protein
MFNSSTSKLLLYLVGIFFVLAFSSNLATISFRVSNAELEKEIEQLEDEKSILRAVYLSEISLDKLNTKAGQLAMKHVSSSESTKVSRKTEEQRLARLLPHARSKSKDRILLVSGY